MHAVLTWFHTKTNELSWLQHNAQAVTFLKIIWQPTTRHTCTHMTPDSKSKLHAYKTQTKVLNPDSTLRPMLLFIYDSCFITFTSLIKWYAWFMQINLGRTRRFDPEETPCSTLLLTRHRINIFKNMFERKHGFYLYIYEWQQNMI